MLDAASKYMRRELTHVLEAVLEFRRIVKKYLLCDSLVDSEDSDVPMEHMGELSTRKVSEEEGIGHTYECLLKCRAWLGGALRGRCGPALVSGLGAGRWTSGPCIS